MFLGMSVSIKCDKLKYLNRRKRPKFVKFRIQCSYEFTHVTS